MSSPRMPPGMWTGAPYLTEDDGLHPNDRGNRFLAHCVADALERMYGSAIRRQASADHSSSEK
jgi:acyl-CoA thioesterase I